MLRTPVRPLVRLMLPLLVVACQDRSPAPVALGDAGTLDALQCTVRPCTGLELMCSDQSAFACPDVYYPGDFCHEYARCVPRGKQCVLELSPKFVACKTCIEACGVDAGLGCDRECRKRLGHP